MKINFIVLIALLSAISMFSCGTLSKQKSKSSSSVHTELTSTENTSESSRLEFNEWQKVWMQQADYSTALIHSDSAIIYHPDEGILLTKGTLLLAKKRQMEALSETNISQNEEESAENSQNVQEQNREKNSSLVSNKEKNSSENLIWSGIIILISIWLTRQVLKRIKSTKCTE